MSGGRIGVSFRPMKTRAALAAIAFGIVVGLSAGWIAWGRLVDRYRLELAVCRDVLEDCQRGH